MRTETKTKQHFFIAGLNIVVREDLWICQGHTAQIFHTDSLPTFSFSAHFSHFPQEHFLSFLSKFLYKRFCAWKCNIHDCISMIPLKILTVAASIGTGTTNGLGCFAVSSNCPHQAHTHPANPKRNTVTYYRIPCWYQHQIKQIKPKRVGLATKSLSVKY